MGAGSKIIAIDSKIANRTILLPEISEKPSVGDRAEPDIEEILKRKPDVVVTLVTKDDLIKKFEDVGIPVVILSYGTNERLDTGFSSGMQESKQLGYLLDAKEVA